MKLSKEINKILDNPEIGKERPDAIALLALYKKQSFTKDKMHLSPVKVQDASEMLSISVHRIRKAKKVLRKMGYIVDFSERNSLGYVEHYIKLLDPK